MVAGIFEKSNRLRKVLCFRHSEDSHFQRSLRAAQRNCENSGRAVAAPIDYCVDGIRVKNDDAGAPAETESVPRAPHAALVALNLL